MPSQEWWKSDRWSLCAPASYVLKNGQNASGLEAFKLGLMELTARGVLKLVKQDEAGGLLRRKREVTYITPGPKSARPQEMSLAAVYDVHTRSKQHTLQDGTSGVLIVDLAKEARQTFGSIDQYTHRIVLQELVSLGLFKAKQKSLIKIIRWTGFELTPAGYQKRADLDTWATTGTQQFPELVQRDPARAVAFAALAGSTVLMASALYPELQRLRARVSDAGYDDMDGFYVASYAAGGGDDGSGGGFELPQIDFSALDLNLDFSALEGLSDISSDIDSGMSDSGGGGDSGGGDSGGGGGD